MIEEQLIKVKKAMEAAIEQKKIEKQELHNSTEEYERRIQDLQLELEHLKNDVKPIERQIKLIKQENEEFEATLRSNGTLEKVEQIDKLKTENQALEDKQDTLKAKMSDTVMEYESKFREYEKTFDEHLKNIESNTDYMEVQTDIDYKKINDIQKLIDKQMDKNFMNYLLHEKKEVVKLKQNEKELLSGILNFQLRINNSLNKDEIFVVLDKQSNNDQFDTFAL